MTGARTNLYDLTRAELRLWLARRDLNPVHAARLWSYLYLELADTFAAMPELPARVRARLETDAALGTLPVALATDSADGFTRKYLLALADGARIETVRMRFSGRVTACISSQVGCAMGCVFCATGQMGYTRHLTPGEIVAQAVHVARSLRPPPAATPPPAAPTQNVCHVLRDKLPEDTGTKNGISIGKNAESPSDECHVIRDKVSGADAGAGAGAEAGAGAGDIASAGAGAGRLRNVVLMGMGEPLHNYDAVMHAIDILRDDGGLALGAERITLSTVGVVPGILRLAQEKRPLHLAVSLHAATQEERAALVPVAKKWPLDELLAACRTYSETTGRRIFYEWTLIDGQNDTEAHARAVGRLLRGLPAQVNLIPLNPTSGYAGAPTHTTAARRFQHVLATEFALPCTVRQRRGIDIAAGCGQLAIGS